MLQIIKLVCRLLVYLENALKIPEREDEHGNKIEEQKDIDGAELFVELFFFQHLLEKSMGPIDILKFLKKRPYYLVANIAYRIWLTIYVMVASVERSFPN